MKRLFKAVQWRLHELYLRIEYLFYRLFGREDKVFQLKRGALILPLAPLLRMNDRRYELKEPYTDSVLHKILKPGMTVFEIGACEGYFTVLISKLIGEKGRCYSFEPMPKYADYLEKNIQLNSLTNVIQMRKAVGLKDSEPITFSDEDETSYRAISKLWNFSPLKSIDQSAGATARNRVEVISISQFMKEKNLRPDLIFIDVEGCETLVFDDLLRNVESKDCPAVYFESHQQIYGAEVLNQILENFRMKGFSISKVTPNHYLAVPEDNAFVASAMLATNDSSKFL